jgi:hypothetical protein
VARSSDGGLHALDSAQTSPCHLVRTRHAALVLAAVLDGQLVTVTPMVWAALLQALQLLLILSSRGWEGRQDLHAGVSEALEGFAIVGEADRIAKMHLGTAALRALILGHEATSQPHQHLP